MTKFIIIEADGRSRDFPLETGRITIGRHSDNDICLSDRAVSSHHAVVSRFLGDSFLEDLGSTNGTHVNGLQIAKHILSVGDVVGIGRNTLKYEAEPVPVPSDNESFEETVMAEADPLPPSQSMEPPEIAPTPQAAVAAPGPARPLVGRLRVISGPNMGKELELSKTLTTIGRPGIQVAAITRSIDGFYIVRVGEGNAGAQPLLNKVEIDTQARRLNDGDVIELVGTEMAFHQDS